MVDQALEDIVEQPDLLVRIVHRAVDEEIGYPAQGLYPASDGSVRERGLQLVEQISGRGRPGEEEDLAAFEIMTLSWSKNRRRILRRRS